MSLAVVAGQLPAIGSSAVAKREPGDEVFWSVTTIIGVLDKPALVPWAVGDTAERTVDSLHIIEQRLASEGRDSAVEYIKKLRWQTGGALRDSELGTLAHGLFDEYALSGLRPVITPRLHPDFAREGTELVEGDVFALRRMLDHFDRFLQEYQPEYLATEVTVYHPDFGYAGQADAFVVIDGTRLIVDYKTSRSTWDKRNKVKPVYPEVGLQLAAYRHASHAAVFRARRYEARSRRYYLLSEAEKAAALPVPEVDGGLAIKITPELITPYPVRCGEREHEAFLYCLETARWQFNESAHVVGNPLTPPHPRADDDPFAGLPEE